MSSVATPPHHRAFHAFHTHRLFIRSAVPADASAIYALLSDPANNPHDTVEPNLSAAVYERRIDEWTAASERGESAFMVILKKDEDSARPPQPLDNASGQIIGFGGFNSFKDASTSDGAEEVKVLMGDTGLLINHRHWRKGYGQEAFIGTLDYGFEELGCRQMLVETGIGNAEWRSMMTKLGLKDYETREVGTEGPGKGQEEWAWRFGKDAWEEGKRRVDEK